jgi:hypothetical protein
VDDPREHVDDELESRLDDLSETLTDDDIRSEATGTPAWSRSELGDADDTDDTDADDADQDLDADDPS